MPLERCHGVRGPHGHGRRARAARSLLASPSSMRDAVAVCLLLSYRHPEHEVQLQRSSDSSCPTSAPRVVRAFSRVPRVRARLDDGGRRLPGAGDRAATCRRWRPAEAGCPNPSSCAPTAALRRRRRGCASGVALLSGPAAGVVGAAASPLSAGSRRDLVRHGRHLDRRRLIAGGAVRARSASARSAVSVRLPIVDLHTVGAGGGSIAWSDAGGALRVGPQSAGADPAGVLRPRRHRADGHGRERAARAAAERLAGGVELDRGAAARAWRIDPAAVVAVVNAEMLRPSGSSPSSAATTRATSRSSRSAAPGRCTPAGSPTSSACARCSSRGRGRAVGAGARRRGRAPRLTSVRTWCPLAGAGECRARGRPTSATAASRSS